MFSAKRKGYPLDNKSLIKTPQRVATASPVKYMVVKRGFFSRSYKVIDTSFEGGGRKICSSSSVRDIHSVARALNRHEGYSYPDIAPGEKVMRRL